MSLALLLATELRVDLEAGHEVVGISAPGRYVERVEALGVRHIPVPSLTRSWDLRSDVRAAADLWSILRSLRLDVLHTHNPKSGVLGRIVGRAARIPAVVNTCHGLWARPEAPLLKRTAVIGVEALASQFSDAELFQNASDREALRWAVPARKAAVVGNGIDLCRFRFDPEGRDRLRREWGVPEHVALVGGVGRVVAEKGLRELATAARSLGDAARVVWIGPADEAGPDRVQQSPDIHLVGERDDMPAVYSALDVFVLPSHREGFSRSAMEAAACGRAIVLSDIRGCREIGSHGRELLLVPPHDAAALTRAVALLVSDVGLRNRLGEAAQRRARTAFDQRAVAARSLETYDAVLSGARSRRYPQRRPST